MMRFLMRILPMVPGSNSFSNWLDRRVFVLQSDLHQTRQCVEPRNPVVDLEHRVAAWLEDAAALGHQALGVGGVLDHPVRVDQIERVVRERKPFAVGDAWGPCWGTTWFRLQGRIPAEWAGHEVVLRFGATRAGTSVPGGEFLIFSAAGGQLPSSEGTPPQPRALAGLSFQHAAATLADGMTPPFVGALPLEIAREADDEVVTVSEEAIADAMRLLMTRDKLFVEGSGAAASAALLSGRVRSPAGTKVVAIVCGGSVDLSRVPWGG